MSDGELRSNQVRCRKDHRCDWCGEIINKGDLAQSRAGIHFGEFYSGHQHPECHKAMFVGDLDGENGYGLYEQKRGISYEGSHDN